MNRTVLLMALSLLFSGCGDDNDKGSNDANSNIDASAIDASANIDASAIDAGANGGDTAIVDLGDAELIQLCEQFHDGICPNATDGNCAPACRATCSAPGTPALMRQECIAPITVDQANECAQLFGSGDKTAFAVCSQGGGCVFDVFDETCP